VIVPRAKLPSPLARLVVGGDGAGSSLGGAGSSLGGVGTSLGNGIGSSLGDGNGSSLDAAGGEAGVSVGKSGVFVGDTGVSVDGSGAAVGETGVSVGAADCVIGTNTNMGVSEIVTVSVLVSAALLDNAASSASLGDGVAGALLGNGDAAPLLAGGGALLDADALGAGVVGAAVGTLATCGDGDTGVNTDCCAGTTRHAASTTNPSNQGIERERTRSMHFLFKCVQNVIPHCRTTCMPTC